MRLALDLKLPADSRFLGATRKALAVYLREFGAPVPVIDDVILAMDEACSNVLQHAYPHGHDNMFLLRADLQRDKILIEVEDEGVGFDIMTNRIRLGEDGHLAASGRGLEVMRRLMTTVEVESPTPAGGTRLRLVRQLTSLGDQGARHPTRA
ncbi:MAG: serine/threonine-protein kinase RsbW [Acidimicrobiaceae bacterium]|nr:serine/threonine-protein kinase RsbW [Acidimicrobiaceae bacterium]